MLDECKNEICRLRIHVSVCVGVYLGAGAASLPPAIIFFDQGQLRAVCVSIMTGAAISFAAAATNLVFSFRITRLKRQSMTTSSQPAPN
jgi:ApbE superfamily uncharacterized protein (UPF0280 family)